MKTLKIQALQSVWDAIEDDPVQAANLNLRSQHMMEVAEYVRQSGLTQTEAAAALGITPPRLNNVLKGKIEKCTVDRLMNILTAIGYRVDLHTSHAASRGQHLN
jgi:predicted XRE-type DNA-binding protein